MTPKEKAVALTKYIDGLKQRQRMPIPAKHAHRGDIHKAWLQREIDIHTKRLEELAK